MNPAADPIDTGNAHADHSYADLSQTEKPAWMQAKERGSDFWLRVMTSISLLIGRTCSRPILYGIALYFSLFARQARRASREYLARCLGQPLDGLQGWVKFFRHVLTFSSTIHDRVFLLNDRFDQFDVRTFGTESLHMDYAEGRGILLLGAHLGSFEILRAIGRTHPEFHVYMAMYPENARRINHALAAINPQATQDIIELGTLDAMLAISARLDAGAYVGVLADRDLGLKKASARKAGSKKMQLGASISNEERSLPFLGTAAQFPVGPFRLATVLKRPVYFMTGVYCGGNRYDIHFEKLEDFDAPASTLRNRDAQVDALMQKYVTALEKHCRAYPLNWFNFYEFWHAN